jgi:hypothetical protein
MGTAVGCGHGDVRQLTACFMVDAARGTVAGNPVATAQVDRAAALLDGDVPPLLR